jgi:26S proteasome regulatory subunit N6
MKAVAQAHKNRNLQEFETALATYTRGKKDVVKEIRY